LFVPSRPWFRRRTNEAKIDLFGLGGLTYLKFTLRLSELDSELDVLTPDGACSAVLSISAGTTRGTGCAPTLMPPTVVSGMQEASLCDLPLAGRRSLINLPAALFALRSSAASVFRPSSLPHSSIERQEEFRARPLPLQLLVRPGRLVFCRLFTTLSFSSRLLVHCAPQNVHLMAVFATGPILPSTRQATW